MLEAPEASEPPVALVGAGEAVAELVVVSVPAEVEPFDAVLDVSLAGDGALAASLDSDTPCVAVDSVAVVVSVAAAVSVVPGVSVVPALLLADG